MHLQLNILHILFITFQHYRLAHVPTIIAVNVFYYLAKFVFHNFTYFVIFRAYFMVIETPLALYLYYARCYCKPYLILNSIVFDLNNFDFD